MSRVFALLTAGNLLGAVITFAYFRYIDAGRPSPVSARADWLHFVIAFSALVTLGILFARRWQWPLRHPESAPPALVRRRALAVPYVVAAVSVVGWTLAILEWGAIWPLFTGTLTATSFARVAIGNLIGGAVTVAFVFFTVEHHWRRRLPRYFPAGDVSATTGVPRIGVRARLLAISLLVSLVPLSVVSVLGYTRAAALLDADRATGVALLHTMLGILLFLVTVGGLAAVALSVFVARSVSAPLGELQAAMASVGQGQLDIRCRVVGNDELGAVAEGFNRMVEGLAERERIRETFGKYVTPEVRDAILDGRVSLEAQGVDVTILFADLRDFTPWVEANDPREVVRDLNDYFTRMEGAIRAQGGLVLQFIGDEIEAVFGAPVPAPGHAEAAVRAALDMRRRLEEWNAWRARQGRPPLRHGIGVHTGRVLAGNIGSPERLSYALVGDAVNVAARLQDLNKSFGTDVLVSATTAARLPADLGAKPLSAVTVKGKRAAVDVYRID